MNASNLLKVLASHPDVRRLSDAVVNRKSDIVVDGLTGSSVALMLAALSRRKGWERRMLCILDD